MSAVILKSLLIIVLGYAGASYPFYYLGGDMLFFLFLKIVRGDFTYWVPLTGIKGFLFSLGARVIVKVVIDFSCCVHYRHPIEAGGLYFSVNYVTPVVGLVLLFNFENSLNLSTMSALKEATTLLGTILIGLSIALYFAMHKDYRKSFYSTETGGNMVRRGFLEGNDLKRAFTLDNNYVLWKGIEGEVELWLKDGWTRWEDEQPEWFTDVWKDKVPMRLRPGATQKGAIESNVKPDVVRRPKYSKKSQVAPLDQDADREEEAGNVDEEDFIRQMSR
eukprot:CAMPEP_0182515326 /NCGR_PEP_ID=MMETSP1321-20130603/37832_1 /TAXON_ID=91990 /ORGANISM="Bolidomonas sp., Strain RCC1657" /LENGTH=275 /DNA_ID=CAMNT_0024722721 /DNA_START=191 /DNA_END=1015 /DNA_ORIENTATION=+